MPDETLSPEDATLVTLARGARGRIGAVSGAAVRDDMGRTYAAANISLPSLTLSALQLAVAQAVAAGATGLEAVVVVQPAEAALDGRDAVCDLGGAAVPVHVYAPNGQLQASTTAGGGATQ